jgi:hypothetical protein
MDLEDVGPDRNRLHDLVKLTWDEAQTDGSGERRSVTDEQIADGGPYSVEQVREHLRAEEGDRYVVEEQDGGRLSVQSVE